MTSQTLRLFWRATWRYKWLLIISEIAAVIFVLATDVFSPFVISKIINKVSHLTPGLSFNDFRGLMLLFLALQAAYFVFGRIMMQTYIRIEPNVIRDLEILSFNKLQDHSLGFFADNFSGALVAKVNRLTAAYQRVVETIMGDFINMTIRYSAIFIILFYLNAVVATVFLIWSILFCLSLVYLHRKKMAYSRAASAAQTRVTARLADMITNTLTIRSFARSRQEATHFRGMSQERRDLRVRSYVKSDYIRIYKGMASIILNLLVLYFSIKYALLGKLNVGEIVLIQLYLFQLVSELWNFGRVMDRLEESLSDAAEMTEVIMMAHEVRDPDRPERSRIREGRVEFNNVTFRYPDATEGNHLFEGLNITIEPGQKVGLVGPSGGGKSSLTKLLLRFVDIQDGLIAIDGQNIAAITQEDLRKKIAYVPQEPLLFHRTIFENIAYGGQNATKKAVELAAQRAHAEEFIATLPHGYDTMVGERGVKLSGGQRQRIAIARAMLKNAPIILLDEATSSLDSMSEQFINKALDELMKKRTTLVIAHRLSTIRKLDRILVMDDGKIIEDGSHDKLLLQGGLYARLWRHQTGDFLGQSRSG